MAAVQVQVAPPISRWKRVLQRVFVYVAQLSVYLAKIIVKTFDLRAGFVPKTRSIRPARQITIPSSTDTTRRIRINVHEPESGIDGEPQKVYINFHGSGFVLPNFGFDAELCTYWADTLGCVVLDADYAKAPKHPFPAAIDDACDVLDYVLAHPDLYDPSRIIVGGSSAGANVAMLATLRHPKGKSNVKQLIVCYPPTNMARFGVGRPKTGFRTWSYAAFRQSYTIAGSNLADPAVSPMYAPSSSFPPILFIVGEKDPLLLDSVELARKLEGDGAECELLTIPNAGHAWEWFVKEGTQLWESRILALETIERRLRPV